MVNTRFFFYLSAGIALLAAITRASAQGCSDAGFCTAGTLHSTPPPAQSDSSIHNNISLSVTGGAGEQGTFILIPQLEWIYYPGRNTSVEIKLPFFYAHGSLGSYSGPGDPVITYSRRLKSYGPWLLSGTAGLRVGTGDAAAADNRGRPLPMPYQRSLGTTDFIAGLSASWKRWLSLSAGYQQPFIQYNHNDYLPEKNIGADDDYAAYFGSRHLRRKGDVLLRADGHYRYHRLIFTAGPLLICHLGKDNITLTDGTTTPANGSEGITLNLTGSITYVQGKWTAELSGGTPMIVRENRPDGLTREWVATLKLSYHK